MVVGGWRLAVDFGTSNTAAAVASGTGAVQPLPLGDGSFTMPSAVLLWDGQVFTGVAAVRQAGLNPGGFAATPKRLLGGGQVLLDGQLVDPVTLVQAVLTDVYRKALRVHDSLPPAQVVLTYPEAWRGYRLELLRQAATGAGITPDHLHLVSEPVAAAWHYAVSGRVPPPPAGAMLAVLDFGGGTVDAALLRCLDQDEDRFVVVDQDGIDPLGGDDFDTRLTTWVIHQVLAEGRHELARALSTPGREALTLRDQVRGAKHTLSDQASAAVGAAGAGQDWVGTLTRTEFNALIEQDLDRAIDLLTNLLHRHHLTPPDLHRLYLTGGSTHIPALHDRLEAALPHTIATLDDPKQVTALGALHTPTQTAITSTPATPPPPPPPSTRTTAYGTPAPPATSQEETYPPPPPPPRGRSGSRDRKKLLLLGGSVIPGVIALALLWNALAPSPGSPEDPVPTVSRPTATSSDESTSEETSSEGPASPTSSPAPPPSSPDPPPSSSPPLTAAARQLLDLVPPSAGTCHVIDSLVGRAMVQCSPESELSGRPWFSTYVLFAEQSSLDAYVEQLLQRAARAEDGPPEAELPEPCPRAPGSRYYKWGEREIGRLACYWENDSPGLIWTQDDHQIVGNARGLPDDVDGLWTWWSEAPIGRR